MTAVRSSKFSEDLLAHRSRGLRTVPFIEHLGPGLVAKIVGGDEADRARDPSARAAAGAWLFAHATRRAVGYQTGDARGVGARPGRQASDPRCPAARAPARGAAEGHRS